MTQTEIQKKVKMYADYFKAILCTEDYARINRIREDLDRQPGLAKIDNPEFLAPSDYCTYYNYVQAVRINKYSWFSVEAVRTKTGEDCCSWYYDTTYILRIYYNLAKIAGSYKIAVYDETVSKHTP